MATMHLLKSSINGSLGSHTGVTLHGKPIIKAKIWSKTPANPTQKASVRSFEKLNRLSSAIAKTFWQWLPLSDKKMYKHNAVAHFLAGVVSGHTFDPEEIKNIIPTGEEVHIDVFNVYTESQKVQISVSSTLEGLKTGTQAILVIAFDSQGIVFFCQKLTEQVLNVELETNIFPERDYYCLAFSSTHENGLYVLGNCRLKSLTDPHLFKTSNYPATEWYIIEPSTFGTNSENVNLIDTSLVIL